MNVNVERVVGGVVAVRFLAYVGNVVVGYVVIVGYVVVICVVACLLLLMLVVVWL